MYGLDCTDMFTYANGYNMTGGHVYLRQRIQHDNGTCLPTPTDTKGHRDMFTYANGYNMT